KPSPKFAPSLLPMTPTMIPSDRFSKKVAPEPVPTQPGARHFGVGVYPQAIHSRAAQLEALNFSCHSLRQLAAESHFTRYFVRNETRFDVLANFRCQLFRSLALRAQHHMRHRIHQTARIRL